MRTPRMLDIDLYARRLAVSCLYRLLPYNAKDDMAKYSQPILGEVSVEDARPC